MAKRVHLFLVIAALLLAFPGEAQAQNYSFQVVEQTVDVFMNADGTVDLDYILVFANDAGASPIDVVDVGFPNGSYNLRNVSAEVDGQRVSSLENSPYVTYGVAVDLGPNAIPPGSTGQVRVFVSGVEDMFFTDSTDEAYASLQFSPTWFGSEFVHGETDLRVTFHLPPGVGPDDGRWHSAPAGFPEEPETAIDDQGQVVYSWRNPGARGDRQYLFGASVPKTVLPASVVSAQSEAAPEPSTGFDSEGLIGTLFCGGIFAFVVLMGLVSVAASNRRKLQYLPPKVSIGGHGVKRGLTAVEAAILLETPMDKVLTMILFGTLKKEAASVVSREPLDLELTEPLPGTLRTYEREFLEAFRKDDKRKRRKALQDVMVHLVKAVAQKMKGFSKRETVKYYRDIMERAWGQVEAADTPQVKSQKFDEYMEWTMLDRDFGDRTQEVFRTGPVYVPVWWGRYDPGYGRGVAPRPAAAPTAAPASPGGRGGVSLPTLPGSAFAANVVTGIQNFSADVVGNLTDFTGRVSKVTNPPPPPSRRGGWSSGGGSCACACAGCACACACAGGGR